jgi:hypothetical protein
MFDGLYDLFMVNLGIVYYCFNHIICHFDKGQGDDSPNPILIPYCLLYPRIILNPHTAIPIIPKLPYYNIYIHTYIYTYMYSHYCIYLPCGPLFTKSPSWGPQGRSSTARPISAGPLFEDPLRQDGPSGAATNRRLRERSMGAPSS